MNEDNGRVTTERDGHILLMTEGMMSFVERRDAVFKGR